AKELGGEAGGGGGGGAAVAGPPGPGIPGAGAVAVPRPHWLPRHHRATVPALISVRSHAPDPNVSATAPAMKESTPIRVPSACSGPNPIDWNTRAIRWVPARMSVPTIALRVSVGAPIGLGPTPGGRLSGSPATDGRPA